MPTIDHGADLFRMTYASRAVLPVLTKFDATVQEIVGVSQANNARMDVTGLLIAHKGWFIQALEGPRRNVSMIFAAIGRDLRHAQLEVMEGRPVEARLFSRWSMCAHTITPAAGAILDALDLRPDFDPFQMDGARAVKLMTAVSKAAPVAGLKQAG